MRRLARALACGLLLAIVAMPAQAESVGDFYRGKQIRAIVGSNAGDYDTWRDVPLAQLEASGQHEVLNWVCLAGAVAELGYKMELVDWVETWMFNAPKCQAIFR